YRKVLRFERVHPGLEDVCNTPFIDEYRGLTFAYGQLRTVLDLIVIALKAIDEGVRCVIRPLNNVDEFAAYFVPKTHSVLRSAESNHILNEPRSQMPDFINQRVNASRPA